VDLLYVVKGAEDSLELRMSLRSVEAHARNVGRLIVTGEPPSWLKDAVAVPCDSPHRRKQMNILRAILKTMETGAVTGPVLYSSDDHYLLEDMDFDAHPWYHNGRLPSYEMYAVKGMRINAYRGSLAATRDLLRDRGLPHDLKMSGHFNTHLDGRDFKAVAVVAGEYWNTPWGYEPSELFAAVARARNPAIVPVKKYDGKVMVGVTRAFIEGEAKKSAPYLSSANGAMDGPGDLRPWLLEKFPRKSRWEK